MSVVQSAHARFAPLAKPLQNFRAALIKFSKGIESASWDQDFARSADEVNVIWPGGAEEKVAAPRVDGLTTVVQSR